MKKLLPLSLLLTLVLWIGCGDDEEDGGPGPTIEKPVRVIAATKPDSLPFTVSDTEWNSVESFAVEVRTSGIALPKPGRTGGLFTVDSVHTQVITTPDYLYLRLKWNDTSHSVWKEYFVVDTIAPFPQFRHEPLLSADEDQMFVMFEGAPGGGWDAWNWRAVTTGAAGFGEGFTYYSVVSPADSLVPDAPGSAGLDNMGIKNPAILGREPSYASVDTSEFNQNAVNDQWILCFDDSAITRLTAIDSTMDTLSSPPDTLWDIKYWPTTSGWTIGQRIPGWLIHCDEKNQENPESRQGSRWDIRAEAVHDPVTGDYTLVMKRKLNTTYPEDINFKNKANDSVKTRFIVGNNSADPYNSSTTNRAISKDFWIIF